MSWNTIRQSELNRNPYRVQLENLSSLYMTKSMNAARDGRMDLADQYYRRSEDFDNQLMSMRHSRKWEPPPYLGPIPTAPQGQWQHAHLMGNYKPGDPHRTKPAFRPIQKNQEKKTHSHSQTRTPAYTRTQSQTWARNRRLAKAKLAKKRFLQRKSTMNAPRTMQHSGVRKPAYHTYAQRYPVKFGSRTFAHRAARTPAFR